MAAIYCGANAGAKTSEEMQLPRGVPSDARHSKGVFRLVSVLTPNAVAVHTHAVRLDIIEADDRLLVIGADMRSNY